MIEVSYAHYQMETWDEVAAYLNKLRRIQGSSEEEVISPKIALILCDEFINKIKELGYKLPILTWAEDGEIIVSFDWPTKKEEDHVSVCFLADRCIVSLIRVEGRDTHEIDTQMIPESLYKALDFLKGL